MHGELGRHAPLFLPGKDVAEAVALEQGPMRIVIVSCHASEAPIVVVHELRRRFDSRPAAPS